VLCVCCVVSVASFFLWWIMDEYPVCSRVTHDIFCFFVDVSSMFSVSDFIGLFESSQLRS